MTLRGLSQRPCAGAVIVTDGLQLGLRARWTDSPPELDAMPRAWGYPGHRHVLTKTH